MTLSSCSVLQGIHMCLYVCMPNIFIAGQSIHTHIHTYIHTYTHVYTQVLKLYDYGNISDDTVVHLARSCPEMRQFSVPSCYSLSDPGIVGSIKCWQNITLLDVSRIPGITDGKYIYIYTHIYFLSYMCMYVCMHACIYVFMYACLHVCMYKGTYTHTCIDCFSACCNISSACCNIFLRINCYFDVYMHTHIY
jgi:hypothetical protein